MIVYQIRDWNDNFENSKSREYDRCNRASFPNKMDGYGMSCLCSEPDGAAIYGVFHMMIGLCSRQRKPRNGWLTIDGKRSGKPLNAKDLSVLFRRPAEEIQRAFECLSSESIGWLEKFESGHSTGSDRAVDDLLAARPMSKNRTEQKEQKERTNRTNEQNETTASPSFKKNDGPGVPVPATSEEWLNWDAFAKVLRQKGISDEDTRSITHGIREKFEEKNWHPDERFLWDCMAICFQAHQREMKKGIVAYVMSWVQESLKQKPPRPHYPAKEELHRMARDAYKREREANIHGVSVT